MFRLEFHTDNSEFDDDNLAPVAARILRDLADRIHPMNAEDIREMGQYGIVFDLNGNNIGEWTLD